METKLPELLELERLIAQAQTHLEVRTECRVAVDGLSLPVYTLTMGNPDLNVPAVGFFGGIHGLERIGTQVLLTFLNGLLARLRWDHLLHQQLETVRLVFMPLINPGGMWRSTRCNPQGVDLMRNAPVDAIDKVPFLLGGQRISPRLPWFRGAAGAPMEAENQAVCRVVEQELLTRKFSIALDCHSGFGLRDRIWFPHAHTLRPIAHLADICALEDLFSQTYPNHNYVFEPQSLQYLTHGDIWDYLYLNSASQPEQVFLPLTLEMGSWLWVKKNPRQLFTLQGMFNPVARHRLQRVLRSHTVWLDFLARAACGHQRWIPQGSERTEHQQRAYTRWYPDLQQRQNP
ncbi:MAG: M14 family zinc carboxypeptidase [Pseudomonadota bacterium]